MKAPESTVEPSSAPPSPRDVLTAEEVADRLRLPLSTVYYLAKTGELPGFQLGRSWRFPAQGIDRLLNPNSQRPRVLVVDDDEVTRTLIAETLRPQGCQVDQAGNVDDGLAAVRRQRFDVLFVDLKMPGRDGSELMRELQGDYALSQMVVITAFEDVARAKGLLDLGPVTLLRKPLATDQLIGCVERVVGRPLRKST